MAYRPILFEPDQQDTTTLGGSLRKLGGIAGSGIANLATRTATGVANAFSDDRTPDQKYADTVDAVKQRLGATDSPAAKAPVSPAPAPPQVDFRTQGRIATPGLESAVLPGSQPTITAIPKAKAPGRTKRAATAQAGVMPAAIANVPDVQLSEPQLLANPSKEDMIAGRLNRPLIEGAPNEPIQAAAPPPAGPQSIRVMDTHGTRAAGVLNTDPDTPGTLGDYNNPNKKWEVAMSNGGQHSYTGNRQVPKYDSATGAVTMENQGGISVTDAPRAEIAAVDAERGKELFRLQQIAKAKADAENALHLSGAAKNNAEATIGIPADAAFKKGSLGLGYKKLDMLTKQQALLKTTQGEPDYKLIADISMQKLKAYNDIIGIGGTLTAEQAQDMKNQQDALTAIQKHAKKSVTRYGAPSTIANTEED